MSLDPRTVALVRNSFNFLRPQGSVLMERFYDRLFREYPYVRPVFKGHDMGRQRLAFMGVLTFLVERCDDPVVFAKTLADLGAAHGNLGVTGGHYAALCESLTAAAGDVAGDLWSDEVHQAWTDFLIHVSKAMLEASG